MCLRFVFLLITRVVAWLRLSRREEAWRITEILILRHQLAGVMVGSGGTAIRVTACGLAWREQDVNRQEEQVLRWPAWGLAA